MVAPKSHFTAKAESASTADAVSEDVAQATELLFNAMLGMFGANARTLLEKSVPQHLIECYDEVKVMLLESGITRPEVEAAIIQPKDERFVNDLLFSMLMFEPSDVDEYVERHFPTMRPKFLGFYKNYGYVHLVNKTEGESTNVKK